MPRPMAPRPTIPIFFSFISILQKRGKNSRDCQVECQRGQCGIDSIDVTWKMEGVDRASEPQGSDHSRPGGHSCEPATEQRPARKEAGEEAAHNRGEELQNPDPTQQLQLNGELRACRQNKYQGAQLNGE